MTRQEFYAALASIQAQLKAPKDLDNKFGGYRYRSAENILAAVKPLLAKHGLAVNLCDTIVQIGERFYLKAVAAIDDGENSTNSVAYAREPLAKKGMDESQVTGSASSYARKYALCGLFGIDDSSADPDNPDNHPDNPATIKRDAKVKAKAAPPAKDGKVPPPPDLDAIRKAAAKCKDGKELLDLYNHTAWNEDPKVVEIFSERKRDILEAEKAAKAAAEMEATI